MQAVQTITEYIRNIRMYKYRKHKSEYRNIRIYKSEYIVAMYLQNKLFQIRAIVMIVISAHN